MGGLSIWHWLIVLAIVMLLFGTGRISNVMGEMAKGVKAFKKGLKDDEPETPAAAPGPKSLSSEAPASKVGEQDEARH